VEDMNIPDVEGMNMVEEQDHPMNHRVGEKGMNMVDEHDHPMNHRLEVKDMNIMGIYMVEVEGMDIVDERPSSHRLEVEDMDRGDSDMGEDMTIEIKMVEREHEGVVLMRHWTSDRAKRHRRGRQEWDELTKSRCSEGHTTFISRDFNYST
jgi:hypothetical protein